MHSTDGRVAVLGDALIDEIRTDEGSTDHVGGAGLNVAVGLSRLGVATTLLASIGDDADGESIRAFLAEYDVELVATINPLGTGRAVSLRVDGEPTYVFTDAAVARGLDFSSEQLAVLGAAPVVAVSSYPFDDPALTDRLLRVVGGDPVRLVVDPNPRPGFLPGGAAQIADFAAGFERVAASTLLVKIGDDDAELVAGRSLDDWQEALLAAGTGGVLATRGSAGASLVLARSAEGTDRHDVTRGISSAEGEVVDTMGAGDATFASIVASLLAERREPGSVDWSAALDRAMDVAAATVRAPGALLRLPR
ncbi:carbohydrate kinase family protein [Frigoribacterium sp. PhB24]|uniref:carbohydrate kinase family protein n=1 Tax=Frigoribacterium sp. PhB24 TaxID=2485204 RepID=UPI000F49FD83|nr:PfkB family carbohydrate kinase [Frigoribacterium sp. PhB24]ROS51299.1 fructokinase [Frigoribacterium sp. PhB24]